MYITFLNHHYSFLSHTMGCLRAISFLIQQTVINQALSLGYSPEVAKLTVFTSMELQSRKLHILASSHLLFAR